MKHLILAMVLLSAPALATTSLQEEGVLALKQAHDEPNGSIYEHGGMIVQNQGMLRFIEPHPENDSPDSVLVADHRMLLSGDMMVATYHTHPCMAGYYHGYFSTADVIVAVLSGVPEFMLDECTGDVHEFFPLIDNVHDTGIDASVRGPKCKKEIRHLPEGRIIGNIGETDPEHTNEAKEECHDKSSDPT